MSLIKREVHRDIRTFRDIVSYSMAFRTGPRMRDVKVLCAAVSLPDIEMGCSRKELRVPRGEQAKKALIQHLAKSVGLKVSFK